MTLPSRIAALLVFLFAAGSPAAGQETYLRTFPGVDVEATPVLRDGQRFFNLHFLDTPAGAQPGAEAGGGLGPLFNRNACSACHPRGGRGSAPDGPDEPLLTALVRLSIPGRSANGGPLPHPAYGSQLNTRAVRGVAPEAEVEITYDTIAGRYGDGTAFELRRPRIGFRDPAYGPLDDALTSLRIGQPIFGLGLLEAVSVDTIQSWADPDDRDGDGISGRMNTVWVNVFGVAAPGRFGWKANEPNLPQQVNAAFVGDIGITNPLFPFHDCGLAQTQCLAADARDVESEAGFAVTDYLRAIAPPPRRNETLETVRRGERLFQEIGCAKCHRPGFGKVSSRFAFLQGREVNAFTDLLLHDMGEGLADGRPDFDATGSEWRTPPLWGLGLAEAVHGGYALLHDGRARSIEEAILGHGGEGEAAREAFRNLLLGDRDAVVAFLNSL